MNQIAKGSSFERALEIKKLNRVACGTACVIMRNGGSDPGTRGDFLMIKRTGAHGEGTWSVPGGWVDRGEDPATTITREVWEEVGLTISYPLFKGYTFDHHPEGIEDVCLWFWALDWSGTIRLNPDRQAEWGWFNWTNIPTPLFHAFKNAAQKGGLLP